MSKKIFLIIVALTLSLVDLSFATAEEGRERAYFQAKNEAGYDLIRPYVRHEFPNRVFSIQVPKEAIEALRKNPNLEFRGYASRWELDAKPFCGDGKCTGRETAETCPADCSGGSEPVPEERACVLSDFGLDQVQYGVKQLYDDLGLTETSGGAGITVSVLDTGAIDHPDIDINECLDFTGPRVRSKCNDNNGHGTHVAGVISADAGNDELGIWGVAPDVTLNVYKVCSTFCWSDDVASAINHAVGAGTDIINMSFGGSGLAQVEKQALDYAAANDVLLVAAAGNDGPGDDTIGYPAAYVEVMGIAAIDELENVADFSSRGINDDDYLIEEREVEMAAAGVEVLSTYKDGCYAWGSGTSMAAPHIAGLAAILWQGTGGDTRTYLQDRATVIDLDALGDDPATGFGLPTVP
jgi:subtilisin family serine protease